MKVSVIIPVYNAEEYLSRAVHSALQQPECEEVILVEDRSPDNCLAICRRLVGEHQNVHLFLHENNENRGPGPSRNLGVSHAQCDVVSFLDADDVYLPGRFSVALKIMAQNPNVDGVYEPVDTAFMNAKSKQRWEVDHSSQIAMARNEGSPEVLFECLIGGHGYVHLNGLTVKKSAFNAAGRLPALRLHEDTFLMFTLALTGRLVAGSDAPVSRRLLHLENVITKPGINFIESRQKMYQALFSWSEERNIPKERRALMLWRLSEFNFLLFRQRNQLFRATFYYVLFRSMQRHYSYLNKII